MSTVPAQNPSSIEQIAEELWQKGYDLRKANAGWSLREPMGGRSVTLASDAELLEYAAGRVTATIAPAPAERTGPLGVTASDATPGSLPTSSPQAGRAWRQRAFYAAAGMAGLCIVLGVWLSLRSDPDPSAQAHMIAGSSTAPAGPVEASQQRGHAVPAAEAEPAASDKSPTGGTSGAIAATTVDAAQNGRDVSGLSDRCIADLKQKFGTGDLSLLVRNRSSQTDICYVVHGREHCPYFSAGHAVFNYLALGGSLEQAGVCDLDVGANAIGNLRVIKTNPDIVQFLINGATPGNTPQTSAQAR